MDEELFARLMSSEQIFLKAAHRIYWGIAEQSAKAPYLVLNIISGSEGITTEGSDDLFSGRVQIDSYGNGRGEARRISRVIHKLLHGYQGGGFQGIFHDSTREGLEAAAASSPYRITQDFLVNWSADNGDET